MSTDLIFNFLLQLLPKNILRLSRKQVGESHSISVKFVLQNLLLQDELQEHSWSPLSWMYKPNELLMLFDLSLVLLQKHYVCPVI